MNGYGQRILFAVVIGASLGMAAPAAARPVQDEERSDAPRRGEARRAKQEEKAQAQRPRPMMEGGERAARVERVERPQRIEQPQRIQQGERAQRRERVERLDRPERFDRAERPQRRERGEHMAGPKRAPERPPAATPRPRPQAAPDLAPARDSSRHERTVAPSRNDGQREGPAWRNLDRVAQERRSAERRNDASRPEHGRRDDVRGDRPGQRLSDQQQRRLIDTQRRQADDYRRRQADRERQAEHYSRTLREQRRTSQYRYQHDYLRRMHELQRRHASRRWDYRADPFFYTPVSYRYYYSGYRYDTNRYGADLLRDAVRQGYEEGFWAGRADRMDGWRPDYRSSYAYQDASYGYDGYYVPYDAYRHYFRQGFRRGYEDGYGGAYRYGTYRQGSPAILPAILATILVLDALD